MTRKFLLIIAFLSALLINKAILADPTVCRESLNKMMQSLNLDETQKSKITPIISELKSKMKTSGSQMDGIEEQLNQQTYSQNMDHSKVDSLVNQKAKLIGDMMKAKTMASNQIYMILNPQQRQQFQSMITQAEQRIAQTFKGCAED